MSGASLRIERRNDSQQVYFLERRLYRHDSPRLGAEERAQQFKGSPSTLVIVPSPLLGYGIDVLLQQCTADCHIVCIEIDIELAALAHQWLPRSCKSYHELSCYLPWREEDTAEIYRKVQQYNLRSVELVSLNGGYLLHNKHYQAILAFCRHVIRLHWQNRLTLIRMGRLWMRNIFRNLVLFPPQASVDQLQSNYPILVVGAGPSTEEYMETIATYRNRICIVAVDSALSMLYSHRIIPNMVVVVEARQWNVMDLSEMLQSSTRYIMAMDISANPSAHRIGAAKRALQFCSRFAPLHFFNRLQQYGVASHLLPALGSVGCVALYLALQLGSAPIFTVGLDCSYEIGKTHAKGAPLLHWNILNWHRLRANPLVVHSLARPSFFMSGKSERRYRTDLNLMGYAEQIRALGRQDQHSRLFDIGQWGLDLNLPLIGREEFVSLIRLQSPPPSKHINSMLQERNPIDSRQSAQAARQLVQDIATELKEYIGLLRRGAQSNSRGRELAQLLDFVNIDNAQRAAHGTHALHSASDYLRHIRSLLAAI